MEINEVWQDILPNVLDIAKTASQKVLEIYQRGFAKTKKSDGSYVTKADLLSEQIISEELKNFGWPIISEESVEKADFSLEKYWLVDPLDGTQDFIQHTGEFSILISLVENGEPILGVVAQVATGDIFYAVKGQGAWQKNNQGEKTNLKTTGLKDSSKARLLISRNHSRPEEIELARKLKIDNLVKYGSVGLKTCKIAAGQADLYFNLSGKTHKWDVAASQVVIQEAGGIITDTLGKQIVFNQGKSNNQFGIVAGSDKELHSKTITAIKQLNVQQL